IVRRPDRHGVADIVVQSPAFEIELEVARIFFRIFAAQTTIGYDLRRKRIRSRVRTWHGCNDALIDREKEAKNSKLLRKYVLVIWRFWRLSQPSLPIASVGQTSSDR